MHAHWGSVSLPETPRQRPHWTDPPGNRQPLIDPPDLSGQSPRSLWTETPWTETPQTQTPWIETPGQRPPPPGHVTCEQNDTLVYLAVMISFRTKLRGWRPLPPRKSWIRHCQGN